MSNQNSHNCLFIESISNVAIQRYRLIVLDQWGVLHNGAAMLFQAASTITKLKQHGLRVAVLSNSGRRNDYSEALLTKLGFHLRDLDWVLTSGEDVYRHLSQRHDEFYQKLGRKFVIFTWDRSRAIFKGLDYQEVPHIEAAEFVVAAGLDRGSVEAYEDDLLKAARLGLPMIVTNPDLVSVEPDGSLKPCPGAIAKRYEELGGLVRWHGKPDPRLLISILDYINQQRRPEEALYHKTDMLMVGDSLHHDIGGANQAGIDSVLITSGIHHQDLPAYQTNREAFEARLSHLSAKYQALPTYAAHHFS